MNCQRFENVVSELARGQMMTAQQRSEAVAHSDDCGTCAARLRDEEMLTRGFQTLVTEMEPLSAPAEVESKLFEAFRARHHAGQVVTPIANPRFNSRYWLAAVAAMLLIAISVFVFRWNKGVEEPRYAVKEEQPQVQTEEKRENSVVPQQQLAVDTGDKRAPLPQLLKPKRVRPTSQRRPQNMQVANHVTNEIATDFIPLSYMTAANFQDGGQIVRVELPRSALANFGLPVNMDRYNEKVKADVLYGVDGLARAIRFVQ